MHNVNVCHNLANKSNPLRRIQTKNLTKFKSEDENALVLFFMMHIFLR